jgi:hypothetical protein
MPTKATPPELIALIRRIEKREGTVRAVAKAIGISEGRLGKVTRGEGSMEILTLLRLTQFADEQPSHVLRIAGKNEEADLIEKLYGVHRASISPSEAELLDRWKQVPSDVRENLRGLIWKHSAPAKRAKKTA